MKRPTAKQIHIMKHTVGFRYGEPSYRNHFVAGEGHHCMDAIESLVEQGLMKEYVTPACMGSEDSVFSVTEKGKDLLKTEKGNK